MALEDIYGSLTDEQKQMVKECKTPEDMLALTKKLGYQLSDEELDAISGGGVRDDNCPFCPKDSQAWS